MKPITASRCATCGEALLSPFALSAVDEPRCGLCRRAEPPFARATAYGSYEGGLRELISLLKYDAVRPAAGVLGRMLREAVTDLEPAITNAPLIVPVPLHASKLRQRGFNQSEAIARAAFKYHPGHWTVDAKVLRRERATASQTGLSRHQRRENIRGAFVVARPEAVRGREALLVDDVFTTGTTVSECARILRKAGASRVWVATVARTLKAEAQSARSEPERRPLAIAAHG